MWQHPAPAPSFDVTPRGGAGQSPPICSNPTILQPANPGASVSGAAVFTPQKHDFPTHGHARQHGGIGHSHSPDSYRPLPNGTVCTPNVVHTNAVPGFSHASLVSSQLTQADPFSSAVANYLPTWTFPVNNQACAQYLFRLFQAADASGSGRVSGAAAVSFFSRSGLSRAVLRQVWDVADAQRKSYLEYQDFVVALRLISMAQCGYALTMPVMQQTCATPLALPRFMGFQPTDMVHPSAPQVRAVPGESTAQPLPPPAPAPSAAVREETAAPSVVGGSPAAAPNSRLSASGMETSTHELSAAPHGDVDTTCAVSAAPAAPAAFAAINAIDDEFGEFVDAHFDTPAATASTSAVDGAGKCQHANPTTQVRFALIVHRLQSRSFGVQKLHARITLHFHLMHARVAAWRMRRHVASNEARRSI